MWISQHLVFAVTGLLAYAVPDLPASVQEKLARERVLEREVIFCYTCLYVLLIRECLFRQSWHATPN